MLTAASAGLAPPLPQRINASEERERSAIEQRVQVVAMGNPLANIMAHATTPLSRRNFFSLIDRFNKLLDGQEYEFPVCCCSDETHHLQKSEGKITIVTSPWYSLCKGTYTQGIAEEILIRFANQEIGTYYRPLIKYLLENDEDTEVVKKLFKKFVKIELNRFRLFIRTELTTPEALLNWLKRQFGEELVFKIEGIFHRQFREVLRQTIANLVEDFAMTATIVETQVEVPVGYSV